jgi:hypothetical protein
MILSICNPSHNLETTEKLHSLLSCKLASWLDLRKSAKHTRNPWFLHALNNILSSFSPSITSWKSLLCCCYKKLPTMANMDSGYIMHLWVRIAPPSTIPRPKEHLYRAESIKTSLHFAFLQNQVRIQIPSFSMLLYVYERSFHACSNAAWTMLNDLLYWEKSDFISLWANDFFDRFAMLVLFRWNVMIYLWYWMIVEEFGIPNFDFWA